MGKVHKISVFIYTSLSLIGVFAFILDVAADDPGGYASLHHYQGGSGSSATNPITFKNDYKPSAATGGEIVIHADLYYGVGNPWDVGSKCPYKSRIFIPPGTTYFNFSNDVGYNSGDCSGQIMRFQEPPTGVYDTSAGCTGWESRYWFQHAKLDPCSLSEVSSSDCGVYSFTGSLKGMTFALGEPLAKGGWFYIKTLEGGSPNGIDACIMSFTIKVDPEIYTEWHNRTTWDAAGDPMPLLGPHTPSSAPGLVEPGPTLPAPIPACSASFSPGGPIYVNEGQVKTARFSWQTENTKDYKYECTGFTNTASADWLDDDLGGNTSFNIDSSHLNLSESCTVTVRNKDGVTNTCSDVLEITDDPGKTGPDPDTTINSDTSGEAYPFSLDESGNILQFLKRLYLFMLALVGLTAFGVLVYAGFLWMLSDTVTSQEEAKKWIYGAIGGVILALAAYLILYTINPDLVNWRLEGIEAPAAPRPPEPVEPPSGVPTPGGFNDVASPQLSQLISCLQNKKISGFTITSLTDTHIKSGTCDPTDPNEKFNSKTDCQHAANSCHYGGQTCAAQGSFAVDIDDNIAWSALKPALAACESQAKCVLHSTHYHVSVGDMNGCGCDARASLCSSK